MHKGGKQNPALAYHSIFSSRDAPGTPSIPYRFCSAVPEHHLIQDLFSLIRTILNRPRSSSLLSAAFPKPCPFSPQLLLPPSLLSFHYRPERCLFPNSAYMPPPLSLPAFVISHICFILRSLRTARSPLLHPFRIGGPLVLPGRLAIYSTWSAFRTRGR